MTALATTGTPAAPAHHPPSATRGLVRTVLRLHRPALYLGVGVFVALAAVLLWLYGPLTDAAATAWRQYDRCQAATCAYDQDAITTYKSVYQNATLVLTYLPFAVAAWAGAALVGREMENGTAALAWTQSVSPARWLAVKLAVPAVLITAGTSVLVLLHRLVWFKGRGRIDTAKPWTDVFTFHTNGPTTVAFALFGLGSGALVGLVLRRSLAALLLSALGTAAAWAGVTLALPYLWPSVTTLTDLTHAGPRSLGFTADEGVLTSTGARIPNPNCGTSNAPACRAVYDELDAVSYYSDSHPFSHYGPLQLVATALLLAVTALAVLVAFRLLGHRTGAATKGAAA
ncbi:ABC transporter permease [Streptomyces sp. NPDC001530]|uniref:ABC transporter permease n=1 Tax=Streptomyces sp. NPDC001530 TaxID=3364582 RepID=UPI0036B6CDAB